MEPSTTTERRLLPRQQTRKVGRIAFNRASSTINCTMRDHSNGGARLEVASVLGIPNTFELRLEGHSVRSGRIVWRKADAIGIEFVSP
jgi:hypothetical protein